MYHKITERDCLTVATKDEAIRLTQIRDIVLLKELAGRWCSENRYRLGGYLGNCRWDATTLEPVNKEAL